MLPDDARTAMKRMNWTTELKKMSEYGIYIFWRTILMIMTMTSHSVTLIRAGRGSIWELSLLQLLVMRQV